MKMREIIDTGTTETALRELAESRIVVIRHDLIVYHTTNEEAAAKIERDGFRTGREIDVNERRAAVYFAGNGVNHGLYARNDREHEPYHGQRTVLIPGNLKGLRLLNMTERNNDAKLPYSDPKVFPLHKAFNGFIKRGDLDGIFLFAEDRIDGTISYLADGRVYEVCVPKNVANRIKMPIKDVRLAETSPSSLWVLVYRGVPANANDVDTTYGIFFSDSRQVAASYAGSSGNVIEFMLDTSRALNWTPQETEKFQRYVMDCRRARRLPPGARQAFARYNKTWDSDTTMAEAIGALLREPPNQVGHHELDPLIGFVRAFINERGYDVMIRPHETGGSMKDGTNEYIVFSIARIKPYHSSGT